ncbi:MULTISPECIES: hypothetical protein [unclassified Undibacterium]|nr:MULTISPECIES: hypothetical protein [unclassified Undibacterium]MEB0215519.1 hypothetical protein [Undibacterium sp. 5I2]MEB0140708.1 hypothetical protein [Undibacterium sp. CCC2.1]MEB0172325.1 hypothetical protein [Undibacterium sp. CCC1.1]MEB0176241.1 hypothetical protein [Undibacterium sp. CCC3.4]WPX44335.1 hypothetical protein RHM61_03640 [Undibacterium sp. CCC3.4]
MYFPRSVLLLAAGLISFSAAAQTAPEAENSSWYRSAKNKIEKILDEGDLSLNLSGYAHHGRGTYTAERIAELNERAWGLGFTKALRDDKDNEELVYGMVISDSHFKPMPMAGYAYQWMKPIGSNWEVGAGYTISLLSRTDYFSGIPFPVPLPVASIGTKNTKLMAAYVPRLSQNKGNGDVLLLFVRIDLK